MAVSHEADGPRERRRIKESAMRRLVLQLVRIQTVAVLVAAWVAGALALGLATGAGAVPTVALMALGPLLGGLLLLIRHNLELASRIGNLADQSTRTFDTVQRVGARVEREIKKDLKQTFRQLEALQNLSAVLPASDVLPATRVWAASPDLLVVLVDLVISERPSLVVECGSGASTLWLALAMRRFGIDGRIIALDHDPVFGAKTRDLLARHDVRDLAEVRDAPLESFSLDGETYRWYARRAWEDLTGIDLLFVDGPPATTGHQARYPALPLLSGSLSPVATAVLDDLVVPDMQKVLQLWLDAYPDFSSEILPLEKQAAVLRRTCAGRLSLEASPATARSAARSCRGCAGRRPGTAPRAPAPTAAPPRPGGAARRPRPGGAVPPAARG
jgi:predicted O-methyltransferase YrrM